MPEPHTGYSKPVKRTVMICEDDRDLLNLFGHALKSKYNVISVGPGEECIEIFIEEKNHGNKIHLLSLDYRLGDCMVMQLLVRLKNIME
jgi:DNA-binding NtrC family response regulator